MSEPYDEELARAFYATMPGDVVAKSEQVFASAKHNLHVIVENLRTDIANRQAATGIVDDSAEFVILHIRMMNLIQRGWNDQMIGTGLLAAAVYELARAPRVPNPLAHLENEGE